jgi:hypothetical protein
MIEGFAVDEHIGRIGFLGGTVGGFAADGNGARINPIASFAPGAVTEVGEKLVEATHVPRSLGRRALVGNVKNL